MNNSAFLSVDIHSCIRKDHQFKCTWSDKNPMKVSLLCVTCSEASGKSAYAAYGDDTKSFGPWQAKRGRHEVQDEAEASSGAAAER